MNRTRIPQTAAFLLAALSPFARADTLKVPQQFATIADAITAAGAADEIVVSKGTYTGNVAINGKSDVTLRAKGKVRIVGANGLALDAALTVSNSTRIVVRGLRVQPAAGQDGIFGTNLVDCVFDRCRVDGGTTGIQINSGIGHLVQRCQSFDSAGNGIVVIGGRGSVVGCRIVRPAADGIQVTLTEADVRDNVIDRVGDDAIITGATASALIADNRITDSTQLAIGIGTNLVGAVIGNRISGGTVGIDGDGDALTVHDNVVADVAGPGIFVVKPNVSTFRNRVTRCTNGIVFDSPADGSEHVANRVRKCSTNGIELMSGVAGCWFVGNDVRKSGAFDLFDSNGTANSFAANRFGTVGP